MNFIIRKSRALWERQASGRTRPKARREARSFESLEGRFLLSGAAPTLKPVVVIETTSRQVVQETPSPAYPIPLAQITKGSPSSVPAARDDSFSLPAIHGEPSVHLDLLWPEGPDPPDGHLIVSDTTGKVLYDFPLTGVEGLHAVLPMISGDGSSTTIDVDLLIHRASLDVGSSGSYQVAIYRGQAFGRIEPPRPPTADFSPNSNNAGSQSPPWPDVSLIPDYPLISATRSLPFYSSSQNAGAGEPNSGGPPGQTSPPATAPPPRGFGLPSGPSAGPNVFTTSSATTSIAPTSASHSAQVPAPTGQGPVEGSNSLDGEKGHGSRPAVVGPLPLRGSAPDGGIFAYPNGSTRGSNDPFEETFTMAPAPEGNVVPKVTPERMLRRSFGLSSPIPIVDGEGGRASTALPFDLDMVGTSLASGAAFLPPFESLAEPAPVDSATKSIASNSYVPRPYEYGSTRPRLSLEGVLITSACFFLGLVAPTCVARLTDWQQDRRWKRRTLLDAWKKRAVPPDLR